MNIPEYLTYIETVKNRFSDKAYSFITEPWHYDSYFHQCPHDSWLEKLEITENYPKEDISERNTDIMIIFFGAYHDSILTIKYKNVVGYEKNLNTLPQPMLNKGAFSNHGDFLYDQLIINEDNFLEHTIALSMGKFFIKCKDIDYKSFLLNEEDCKNLKENLYKYYI